ncbi:surface carbohydrate biosynthesis protein [Alkalibacillus filiformis]|uniref:Surface carbohydrate biosynthesis protein n=1 Tax=Alkalibacillus filiformis TaxID=200990 RepID=A0ABU0DPL6_9BACI|nr:surface carbohydrate biosynthesis protein [Alkalibacillus filiformis]MDQ0350233.1 surface carbohydrate biosynthesis protein [Alkalibacillus filiformis]
MTYLFLPVEVKVRELDAKMLLAYYAAQEGFRVVIGEQTAVERAALELPQGIFFAKGYPDRYRSRVVKKMKAKGHRLIELDEEGLIMSDRNHYLEDRMNKSSTKQFDQIYCWGTDQKELIESHIPNQELILTGNPRFDLLKEKFRPLYKQRVKSIQTSYGSFILLNTRFSIYNPKKKNNQNEHEQYDYMKQLFQHFIKLTEAIAREIPYQTIIIRPHPSENLHTYQKRFESYDNIVIAPFGNVIDWILASQVIIHNGCTTGLEAFLLNKPSITYMPIEDDRYDVFLPNQFSEKATTIDSVLDAIQNIETIHPTRKQHNILDHYVASWSAGQAYEKIINALKQLNVQPKQSSSSNTLQIKKSKKAKYRFSRLSEEDLKQFFKKINQIEKKSSSFQIKPLGQDVYEITLR